jgi:two-component sensor histidine kinase
MNTVASLLRLQSDAQADPALSGILQDAGGRVQSMMVLYDRLYRSDSADELSLREYLLSLVDEIADIFPRLESIRVETRIEDMLLGTKILSPLGIIVNELITNAIKYAFAGRDRGLISIGASRREGLATIVFEDDGIGLPESVTFEQTTSFGMQLVKMLVEQIRGSIAIERGRGTRYVIQFEA